MFSATCTTSIPSAPVDESIRLFLTEAEALNHVERAVRTSAAALRRSWRDTARIHSFRATVRGESGAMLLHRALTVHGNGTVKELHGRRISGVMEWNHQYGFWNDPAAPDLPYSALLTAARVA